MIEKIITYFFDSQTKRQTIKNASTVMSNETNKLTLQPLSINLKLLPQKIMQDSLLRKNAKWITFQFHLPYPATQRDF